LHERPDEHLVAACRHGDREAFAELVHRHTWRVYATCLGIVGEASDSDDLTQETFIKGMAQIFTLRDGTKFGGWIVQIARNLSLDFVRTRTRRHRLLERHAEPQETAAEDFSDLYEALAELPERDRLPLVLYYLDGESAARLAEELEISTAGAHTRLSRARRELRRLLAGKEGAL
jgi:RNA polymerase sigma-70 factor (ECF subfamily)